MEKKSHKKVIFGIILSIFVFIGLWTVLYIHYSSPTRLAMEYIYNHTEPSGRFVYMTNINPEVKYKDNYNAIRHAGVLYSMYLCERIRKDKLLRDKRILASKYFINKYILPYKDDMFVVTENGETAKLGGAGLALVALSNLYPDGGADIYMLRGLGKSIVYLQKPDGSFYSGIKLKDGKYSDFESLYYPGEAALGLLYLYEIDKDKLWIDTARKALLYLAQENLDINGAVFDHWMLIATKKLLETSDNGLTADETIKLKSAAKKLSDTIIMKQITYSQDPYVGSFVLNRNLNTISTIVEGLSAAYYIVDKKYTKEKISNAIKLSLKYIDKYQVKTGKLIGGIPAKPDWEKTSDKSYSAIRIDNVQHALSAFLTSKAIR